MRDTELLKQLKSIPKAFFSIFDLEKITGLERSSMYISLNRLVNRGVLERIGRNMYTVAGEPSRIEAIAGQAYFPCYLSFESALSRFGVLNLVPYSLSFATTRKTKATTISSREVLYRHIKKELFFGFTNEDGFYLAEPEKALLDLVYFSAYGKTSVPSEELDLKSLSGKTLDDYSKRFPPVVARTLETLR
ncbi:MAG: hypothetical protein JW738_02175 [Actinobacteria bacterium]|nr:hypothetical protein [Actinomycetota bacterium]